MLQSPSSGMSWNVSCLHWISDIQTVAFALVGWWSIHHWVGHGVSAVEGVQYSTSSYLVYNGKGMVHPRARK